MKEQLLLLTRKLEKETIVNERLTRRSMKEKADKLTRQLIAEGLVAFIMIPFFILVLPTISKVSMFFCIFSAGFFALGVLYNFYMYGTTISEDVKTYVEVGSITNEEVEIIRKIIEDDK